MYHTVKHWYDEEVAALSLSIQRSHWRSDTATWSEFAVQMILYGYQCLFFKGTGQLFVHIIISAIDIIVHNRRMLVHRTVAVPREGTCPPPVSPPPPPNNGGV